MNAKAEYNSGMLRGNGLHGDNGAPTPKSGKKARLTLALPRGKADLEAQARRARDAERGLIDREKVTPWQITPEQRKQCEAMPKDTIVSVDIPSAMGKVAKNMTNRAWRPGDPDGSEPFALPGGNAMPIQKTRGKASWTESPGYVQAAERADLLTAPKTVKPRPDRQNRPKREVVIVHKTVKAKNKA
jgi:hypothetical protein